MSRRASGWIGQLGPQLTLAFVGVALAAVLASVLIAAVTIGSSFNQLVRNRESDLARSTALATAVAVRRAGWAHADLHPIVAFIARSGAGVQVRAADGTVEQSSPGYKTVAATGPKVTDPVISGGHEIGLVTLAFDRGTFVRAIALFTLSRWRSRLLAAASAILIAILVAIPLSRAITRPVDRLTWATHARRRGDSNARVGDVRGLGKLRELSSAFDEMADAGEEQDQVRRNLVADVAHELRTPIAVLQAGHEAMLDGLTEPTDEHLGSLRDEVLRLARMADDLQRLASAEAAALQLTLIRRDLAAVAATAAASLVDSFEASNVTLVERLSRVEVMCDPLRMHEVVVNLLTNALKFTPSGGQVTVETERAQDSGRLRVTDTGVGIAAEDLPHITERFYRSQRSSDIAGSGIGLTIVSELIRAHQGTLEIESEQGLGTSISVSLPLVSPNWPAERKPREPRPPSRPGSKRRHKGIIDRGKEAT
ncbi:MAG TPA: HAMP domain-containing sensor histidine kinase [Streptosporangiaceae bacterium]|nr:HAMP domain-containing sensor histidine kinase [Streptosporangiaceae bacterium]